MSHLDEFYFRWLENSVIEIGKSALIPLIFHHLNWNPSKQNKYSQAYELYTNKNKKSSGAFSGQKSITRPSELHQYYVKDDYFRKWIKNESGAVLNLARSLAGGAREPSRILNPSKVNRTYKSSSIYYESFDRLPTWHSFWFSSWPKIKSDLERIWCDGSADSESCQAGIHGPKRWSELTVIVKLET